MKNLSAVILLTCLLLTSCTNKTKFGDCIGIIADKDPAMHYELSWWNAGIAFLFSETVIVPVVTLASVIQCPVGKK